MTTTIKSGDSWVTDQNVLRLDPSQRSLTISPMVVLYGKATWLAFQEPNVTKRSYVSLWGIPRTSVLVCKTLKFWINGALSPGAGQ